MSVIATLVVDMQVDFFAHENLARLRPTLVASTNALVAAARDAKCPVIWVTQVTSPDLADASLEVRRNCIKVVILGTPGASILPELNVEATDEFVVKKQYSAFFRTDLDERLSKHSCRRIIVAGVNTHACVRTTVVDAYQRDYEVLLAQDCIASYDQEHHDVSWRYMNGKLGRGLTTAQLLDLLHANR